MAVRSVQILSLFAELQQVDHDERSVIGRAEELHHLGLFGEDGVEDLHATASGWGRDATSSSSRAAISAGASSWMKCPPFSVTCLDFWVAGTRALKRASPPRVIGSASEKAVRNGLSKRSSTFQAASFSAVEAGSGGVGSRGG